MDELLRRLTATLRERYFNKFRVYEFSTALGLIWIVTYEFTVAHNLDLREARIAASVIAIIASILYARNPKTLEWAADDAPSDAPQSVEE